MDLNITDKNSKLSKELNTSDEVGLRTRLFQFFYYVLRKKDINLVMCAIFLILESLQLISYAFSEPHTELWKIDADTMKFIRIAVGATRIAPLMDIEFQSIRGDLRIVNSLRVPACVDLCDDFEDKQNNIEVLPVGSGIYTGLSCGLHDFLVYPDYGNAATHVEVRLEKCDPDVRGLNYLLEESALPLCLAGSNGDCSSFGARERVDYLLLRPF